MSLKPQGQLGCQSLLVERWEAARVAAGPGHRHHLDLDWVIEELFWVAFDGGASMTEAARTARVSRSTAYRWWQRRFDEVRERDVSVRAAARQLRISSQQAKRWGFDRRGRRAADQRAVATADAATIRAAARQAALLAAAGPTPTQLRDIRY